jgi:uncharacterized membrane protein
MSDLVVIEFLPKRRQKKSARSCSICSPSLSSRLDHAVIAVKQPNSHMLNQLFHPAAVGAAGNPVEAR